MPYFCCHPFAAPPTPTLGVVYRLIFLHVLAECMVCEVVVGIERLRGACDILAVHFVVVPAGCCLRALADVGLAAGSSCHETYIALNSVAEANTFGFHG